MLEPIKVWLRGDYNSIRYKYYRLPKEWLEYILLYRLCGKSWVDFYAARLDRAALINPDTQPPESYTLQGLLHLEYMKSQGLEPSQSLLDYGCGVCRSGVNFAKYLNSGNYVGADISRERLKRGKAIMEREGLASDSYQLTYLNNCHLSEFQGMTFDYVFAKSVLTHMPEKDIRTMLLAMRSVLKETGKFYFTYSKADNRKRRNIKDFWYTKSEMRTFCEEAGYEYTVMEDWQGHSDVMARVSMIKSKTER